MAKQPFLPPLTMHEACTAFIANWEEELIEYLPNRRKTELDEVAMVFCGAPAIEGGRNPGISEACRGVDNRKVIQRKQLEKGSVMGFNPHDEL